MSSLAREQDQVVVPPLPVRQRRNRWPWAVLLVAAVLVGGLTLVNRSGQSVAPTPVVDLAPAPVPGSGTVLPLTRSTLGFAAGGRVSQIYVAEGEAVRVGQPIARLDPASLAAAAAAGLGAEAYLLAPFDGIVGQLHVRQFETVVPGQPVATIGDANRLRIEVDDVAETDIGQVKVGQPVSIALEALPGQPIQGYVESVAAVARERQGQQSYRVIVGFAVAPPATVRWGMTANVDIEVGQRVVP